MNDRKIGLDLLRIWCCFCIIGIHVSGQMTDYSYLGYRIIQGVVRPPLWAFMTLTGYFVLSREIKNIGDYYYRSILKLLVPLICYLALYHLYYNRTILGYNIFSFLKGDTIGHLWYVYALIPLYITIPFLQKMLFSLSKRMLETLLIIVFLFVWGGGLLKANGYVIGFNIELIGNCFLFFLFLGYYLNRHIINVVKPHIIVLVVIGVIDVLVTAYEFSSPVFYSQCCELSLCMVVGVVVLFVLFDSIKIKQEKINKVIAFLSKRTYSIYLIHMLPLVFLNDVIRFDSYGLSVQVVFVIIKCLVVFILSLMISCAVDSTVCFVILSVMNKIYSWAKIKIDSRTRKRC